MYFQSAREFKVIPKSVFAELPETYKLSKEQLQFYDVNGYLVLKKLIDFGSLYSYKRRFQQICNGVIPRGHMTVQKDRQLMDNDKKPEDYVVKLQDIMYDEVFSGYFEFPVILDVVSQFLGENLTAMHTMFINKPPGTGRHPPHQDLYYFPFRPADKIIASWTAIDDVTVDNGCLFVIPTSHRGSLYAHGYTDNTSKMYHGILEEDSLAPAVKRIDLEMSPGDTVFFHPMLVHGSRANVSNVWHVMNYRKSISCHFASSECHFIDVTGTVQQGIADEIVAEGKRRGYGIGTIQDIWRARSKIVRGVKSNL